MDLSDDEYDEQMTLDAAAKIRAALVGDPATLDVWSFPGETGGALYLAVFGGVVMLHTGDELQQVPMGQLLMRQLEGRPVEMTRERLRGLAEFILRAVPADEPPRVARGHGPDLSEPQIPTSPT